VDVGGLAQGLLGHAALKADCAEVLSESFFGGHGPDGLQSQTEDLQTKPLAERRVGSRVSNAFCTERTPCLTQQPV
jgi:hypothetical protein